MRTMRTLKAVGAALALAVLALAIAGPATAKDRNNDGIPDRWERKHGLSLKKNQARRDQDRDGLRNKAEYRAKTHPRDEDTDDDGVEDGDENAGTIESYDPETGKLKINAFNGEVVTGLVTEDTRIRCGCNASTDEEDDDLRRHPDEGDDSSGPGGHEGPGGPHDEGEIDDDPPSPEEGEDVDRCSTDVLVPGAAVHEAELALKGDGLVFTEIEMARDGSDSDEDTPEGDAPEDDDS